MVKKRASVSKLFRLQSINDLLLTHSTVVGVEIMRALNRILAALAITIVSAGAASAATLSEEFVFSYTTAPGGSFTLSNLSVTNGGGNLLVSLLPFTTALGGTLTGSGSLSEVISINTSFTTASNFNISNTSGGFPAVTLSLSPVPLPASSYLFGLALISFAGVLIARRKPKVLAFDS
jgi:hypothetical protein